MVERSRRKREMHDIDITRMFLTTAVLAAVAALLAGPAGAFMAVADADDGSAATLSAPTPKPGDPGTIPYLSHGIGVDKSIYSGEEPSLGLTGDSALTRVERDAVAAGTNGLDPAIRTAVAAKDAGTTPNLSHAQPSLGLTGDSPLTRGQMPAASTAQAVSSGDDFGWTWVGVGGGLAALLAAAMGGFYLSARHRGRIALP
jgi:hypothetical protein